jgi:hypothetical protein
MPAPRPHPGCTPNVTRYETHEVLIMQQQHAQPGQPATAQSFPTDPSGLPEATRPDLLELANGDDLHLRIGPVAKRLGDTTVRMLGYNGSIPGPTLKVRQGSEVVVHVTNDGDLDATVHWHGLQVRRCPPRDPNPDPGRRRLHLPHPVPRPGPVLVPPAHPRGLHPGDGPVRQHPGRPRRPGILATR